MKILPCGHMTYREHLQVRIYCSTREDQDAQELCYSTTGVKANEDGDFEYKDILLSESPLQQTHYGDFTKLVCCRDKSSQCGIDANNINDWTWTDFVTRKFHESVYSIRGYQKGEKHWFIILLFNRGAEFIEEYKSSLDTGSIDISKWGYVLKSGKGRKGPPTLVLKKVIQWTFV